MGNSGSQAGGDTQTQPSLPSAQQPAVRKLSDITLDKIREGFRRLCDSSGHIPQEKFNDALSLLETIGLRRLRDSPLGQRLFHLFDTSADNRIAEDEFCIGINILTNGTMEQKLDFTFRAFDCDGDGFVSKTELLQMMEDSWLAVFKILSQEVKSKTDMHAARTTKASQTAASSLGTTSNISPPEYPTIEAIQKWATANLSAFREVCIAGFDAANVSSNGRLDRREFSNWISADRTVRATLGDITVSVAVSLLNIDQPPLYPSLNFSPPSRSSVTGAL
eukprot:GILJ01005152.1.p1 GENE.GILJ01005152.1~~GILJ01005152.1.p1  ORF type:complete len:278 (+),score=42.26 GILJ01005152.1:46-879(+)